MYCTKCAKELADDVKFCDSCGEPTASTQAEPTYAPKVSIGQENKVIFILSYLGILFFLPLVACPESKVGRFHANQGLVLFIAGIVVRIVLAIFSSIILAITSALWPLVTLLNFAFGIATLYLMIIGMVNANKGLQKPLPIIGGITILK